MSTGAIFGHLTFALLVFLLLPARRLSPLLRVLGFIAVLAGSFFVVDGLSLGDYTRSYTDDLAITTLLWMLWALWQRLVAHQRITTASQRLDLVVIFAVLGVFLYPASLGLSDFDPYRLGFSPAPLLVVIWLVCLFLWWRHNHIGLVLIASATLAWLLDIKDSDNYWDYLIDPLLWLFSLVALGYRAWPPFRRVLAGN